MSTWEWLGIVAAVVVVGALLAYWWSRRQRTQLLKQRFGPEYDATVERAGDRDRGEQDLRGRVDRVGTLELRSLTPTERNRFAASWDGVQAQFVDRPREAVREADALVTEVMAARGYPIADFEQQSEDVSVDHPMVIENYRAGHAVYESAQAGAADTERLRSGFVHYRALFDELLVPDRSEPVR